VFSQSSDSLKRNCYTHKMTEINKDKFPDLPKADYREILDLTADEYVIIPVVVHVIHNGGPENISDELIKSQIDVLNEDFGHYGTMTNDPRGADMLIRFCLAKKDPDGNPTTGIIRVKSEKTNLIASNEMETKSLSYWDPTKYMNIWIVNSIDMDNTVQGYSYMPSNSGGPSFQGDGIVLNYRYFGRNGGFVLQYNHGRTCTHEVGHYFDLKHPWGGDNFKKGEGNCHDDDGIYDTPNCSADYYSAPPVCNHPQQCGNIRMIENFMDYSLDACMKIFTTGQKQKMLNAISKYRGVLVSYNNLISTGCINLYDSVNSNSTVDIYPNPASNFITFETHLIRDTSNLNISIYDYYGRMVMEKSYNDLSRTSVFLPLYNISPGVYIIKGSFGGEAFLKKIVIISSF